MADSKRGIAFKARYGMNRTEWAKHKKKNPAQAHAKRMEVQRSIYTPKGKK